MWEFTSCKLIVSQIAFIVLCSKKAVPGSWAELIFAHIILAHSKVWEGKVTEFSLDP